MRLNPVTAFLHDRDFARVQKVDSSGTTRYVHDGASVVAEADGSGNLTKTNTPGIGFTLAGTRQTYYFDQDALGSTTAVTDAGQSHVDWYWYMGYGLTSVYRQGVYTPHKYVGKLGYYADGDSGMLLLGRRYYLPSFHRFLTQDPAGQKFGDGSRDGQRLVTDLNLYAYAGNNPLLNVDPTGEDWKDAGKWTYRHVLTPVGHLLGHIWTSPNTALGLVGSIGGSYKVDISN